MRFDNGAHVWLGLAWQAHKEEKAFLFQLLDKVRACAHASCMCACARVCMWVSVLCVYVSARARVCASLSARVWSA